MDNMSADLDNQPYDNVEFPIRRPPTGKGSWNNQMSTTHRENLITGATKEKTHTLAPVAEGGGAEEEEEMTVEDQRQKAGVSQSGSSNTEVVTTPPRAPKANHVTSPSTPLQLQTTTEKQTSKSETFPRVMKASTKPPPSPSQNSKGSFVIDQPKSTEEFTWGAFNPMSQDVFENAYTRHKYFYKFSDKVLKQGNKMKANVWDIPGRPGESLTYEQLLQGVLVEGEKLLLGGSWLYFRDVEFYEPECSKQIKPPLGEGRICLTNLRMLLLCAEMAPDAKLTDYGNPTKEGKGGYKLTVSKLNNVYFQNIPIDCFESVELSSSVGTMAESKLTQRKPSCCGLFSCVGVGRCGYTWDATPPIPVNVVKRVVRIGVYMPPWRTPAIIVVNLHPKMSLTSARDFVSQLQNHVPQMQYHMKHGSTVL